MPCCGGPCDGGPCGGIPRPIIIEGGRPKSPIGGGIPLPPIGGIPTGGIPTGGIPRPIGGIPIGGGGIPRPAIGMGGMPIVGGIPLPMGGGGIPRPIGGIPGCTEVTNHLNGQIIKSLGVTHQLVEEHLFQPLERHMALAGHLNRECELNRGTKNRTHLVEILEASLCLEQVLRHLEPDRQDLLVVRQLVQALPKEGAQCLCLLHARAQGQPRLQFAIFPEETVKLTNSFVGKKGKIKGKLPQWEVVPQLTKKQRTPLE